MFRFSASHPAVSRQQGGAVVEVEESKNRSFMGSDLIWKCHPRRYVTLLGVGRPRLRLAGIRILLVSGTSIHDPFNQFFIIKKEEIEKDNTNPRFFFFVLLDKLEKPIRIKTVIYLPINPIHTEACPSEKFDYMSPQDEIERFPAEHTHSMHGATLLAGGSTSKVTRSSSRATSWEHD